MPFSLLFVSVAAVLANAVAGSPEIALTSLSSQTSALCWVALFKPRTLVEVMAAVITA